MSIGKYVFKITNNDNRMTSKRAILMHVILTSHPNIVGKVLGKSTESWVSYGSFTYIWLTFLLA